MRSSFLFSQIEFYFLQIVYIISISQRYLIQTIHILFINLHTLRENTFEISEETFIE